MSGRTVTRMLPRSWSLIVMHITKNFQTAGQSSGRVKIFCSEKLEVLAAVKKK
jgi:hypothetical protein